jgi:DNA-binding response OmpR family regulator
MRLLVVEDEPAIADFLARGLRSEGHAVTCAADAAAGEAAAIEQDVDLVILDLVLPDRSGLEVLRAIRAAKPALPVIVLSARSEVEDRVAGLDLGANDYVAKPFSFAELAARVRASLRRPDQVEATRLSVAGIDLDLVGRTVSRDGTPVGLSPREFDLLAYFLRHPNQVLSREQLLSGVWGYAFDPGTNVVEVYVGYLRRKLATDGTPAPIATMRSVGYKLVDRA